MSIEVVSVVLKAPISPPTKKLAAVALANWCNEDGGSLYPSMTLIANTVGISRSQAQRIVHGLIDEGLLSVVANGNGGKPGATPHYQLHLDRIRALDTTGRTDATGTGSAQATGRTDATGSVDAAEGSHGCTGGVAPMHKRGRMGATLTVIEPSVNHQQPSRAARPRSRSRSSREVEHPLFAEFYAAYPRKVDPKDAAKAFAKLNPDRDLLAVMLRAIDAQGLPQRCAGGDEQFVPHPATWINKRRWEIQVAGSASNNRSWHGAVLDRDPKPPWLDGTGYPDVFSAENAGCGPGNAAKFRNGEKAEA